MLTPMTSGTRNPGAHILPLDGLRGLASLSVIVYHMWPITYADRRLTYRIVQAIVSFGWSGVDLFFVLSGFLITGILLRSKSAEPARYFRVFYGRRILRVFPIYYLLLVFFFIVVPRAPFFQKVNDFWIVKGSAWPYWAYLSNWPGLNVGTHSVLCVCWSLAIEEQYYAIWPLTVRLTTPRLLGLTSVALLCGSAIARTALLNSGVSAADLYHMTFTHLDGIALGSALAVAHSDSVRWGHWMDRLAGALPFLGIALVAVVLRSGFSATTDKEAAYQSVMVENYWLVALFYGSLLAKSLRAGWLQTALSHPFLRRLGRYSYAAYLVQFLAAWIVSIAFRHLRERVGLVQLVSDRFGDYTKMCLSVGLSYGLAALSWAFLEGPLNSYKDRARWLRLSGTGAGRATPRDVTV